MQNKTFWLSVLFAALSATTHAAPLPPAPVNAASAPANSSGKMRYSDLTPDERSILNEGEVSTPSYIIGGIVGTVLGLGIGQAIEGRYLPTGLIMTVGQATALALIVGGTTDCVNTVLTTTSTRCSTGLSNAGVILLVGLRLWEIVDVWAAPPSINSRYRNLKSHVEDTRTSFMMAPSVDGAGGGIHGAQFALQYRF